MCDMFRSIGQPGLREDMRAVQRSSAGQPDRRRTEPGQRRGPQKRRQILSGDLASRRPTRMAALSRLQS